MASSTTHSPPTNQPLSTSQYLASISASAAILATLGECEIAIILGSGLNSFTDLLTDIKSIPYSQLPNMVVPSVKGHSGMAISGTLNNTRILCFSGRVHPYEGYSTDKVNYIMNLIAALSIKTVILTNSSGGALKDMVPGSVMIIRDHIRCCSINPLEECTVDSRYGKRLIKGYPYSKKLGKLVKLSANELNIPIFEGAYCFTGGPTYETPSEVNAGINLNCGAFGMSTVTEVIAAHNLDIEVLGLSLITNVAAGLLPEHVLSHSEVTDEANKASVMFQSLLVNALSKINSIEGKDETYSIEPLRIPHIKYLVGQYLRPFPNLSIIENVVYYFQSLNKGASLPNALIVFGNGMKLENIISRFNNARTCRLNELPGSELFFRSASARNGLLTTATNSITSQRVALLTELEHEGFDVWESNILISALNYFGITSIVAYINVEFPVEKVDLSVDSIPLPKKSVNNQLFNVEDVLDRTQVPFIPLLSDVKPLSINGTVLSKNSFSSKLGLNSGSVVVWNGPSFPTDSESYIATLIGANFISIFSPSIYLNSLNLNWNVSVIAALCDDLSIPNNLSNGDLNNLFNSLHESCNNPSDNLLKFNHLSEKLITIPLNQENPLLVNSFVAALATHFNELPKSAIFVERFNNSILSNYQLSKSIRGCDLNGWIESHVGGTEKLCSRWLLSIGTNKATSKTVLVVHSDYSHETFVPNLYLLQFIVRGLKIANFTKLIFTGLLSSCSSKISAGGLALITDHVNVSGWNPLSGHNNDVWGTRFPDMSNAYSKTLNSIIRNTAEVENITLLDTITAHYSELTHASSLACKFTNLVTCNSMCSGVIPNIIVANHMKLESVCIAFINTSSNDEKFIFGDKEAKEFDKLVNSII